MLNYKFNHVTRIITPKVKQKPTTRVRGVYKAHNQLNKNPNKPTRTPEQSTKGKRGLARWHYSFLQIIW
jgi:hypothetical protein